MRLKTSKAGKVGLGVVAVGMIGVLWYGVYNYTLSVDTKRDVITSEQIEEMDKDNGVFYDAKITVNDKEYDLSELTKDIVGDNVVVQVSVNDRTVQGYVTVSDMDLKPRVVLSDQDNYAQVILPDKSSKN